MLVVIEMINIIRKLYENKTDEECHYFFVRYGCGEFEKEQLEIKIGNKIKVYGGFDMTKTFLKIFAESLKNDVDEDGIELRGVILSSRDISNILDRYKINFEIKKRYGKKGDKYLINTKIDKRLFMSFINEFNYNEYLLIKIRSKKRGFNVKKDETPQPSKVVDKFVTLTLSKEDRNIVIDEFLFDCREGLKEKIKKTKRVDIKIKRKYFIDEIIVDEELITKDPKKARLQAKRKGAVKREVWINKSLNEYYKKKIEFFV